MMTLHISIFYILLPFRNDKLIFARSLADDNVEITADKLQSLISAAKVEEVEPIWTTLFAKVYSSGTDVAKFGN